MAVVSEVSKEKGVWPASPVVVERVLVMQSPPMREPDAQVSQT